jgi:glutamate carboxypeptidase
MLLALQAYERSPWAEKAGWEVLINPDEEIGSPGSAPLLIQAAKRNHLGLVYEPSFQDGNLVGARKGSGNFTVIARGKAAHAGRNPQLGRNAIDALARFIVGLASLDDAGGAITTNVGYIQGGGPVNVVPDLAECRFNVRVVTQNDQKSFEDSLRRLAEEINKIDGISLELHGGFRRPPKPLDAKTLKLLEHVAECGRDLGLSLQWRPTGGACDGNNLAAAGLTTIDSLGVTGGDIHSSEEYILLDSLAERAKLTALLLMKLAAGEIEV